MSVPSVFPDTLAGARVRSRRSNKAWQSGPLCALASRFAGLDEAAALREVALATLAEDGWIADLLAPLLDGLRADPWFEPGLKASRDALRTGIALLDTDRVAIAATITHAAGLAAAPAPTSIIVPGRIAITRYVRGGGAILRRWRTIPVPDEFASASAPRCSELAPVALHDGQIQIHDGRTDGQAITFAQSDVVAITITIKLGAASLVREYDLSDGRFLRAASADDMASRMEMLMTFLRVSGRSDATGVLAEASHHSAFSLRWAAMREWLMLDAAGARPRLRSLAASDANAEVRAAASVTLAALDRRMPSCPA